MECCSTPLQWLCEVAGYWRELENAIVHVQASQTCSMGQVGMPAMEDLGYFQLPGIVYRSLRHGAVHYYAEVMAADEWHDSGPQDLITVSLGI